MPREDAAQFNGKLSTATYPNKYSTVIPVEAPFYRIGLTLTVTDPVTKVKRKLIEGLDYFLAFYFKELAEAEDDQIYGGIMLLNATDIEYELLAVGRQYRIPASEIGKYLVKTDNKDPRNVDWSELMKYPPIIAPIDPPKDLEEAILRDEIVKALDDIRQGIVARAGELDEAFTEVTNLIFENGKRVFDEEMYQHHLIKNAHNYTCADIGALPVLGKAVDATKAFGRTLAELVNLMSSSGIQQQHIDTLLDNTLGDLLGRMRVLNNDAITFQTSVGHVITMKGEKFIITSPKPLTLKADQDNNEPGLATEFGAGLNTLYVHSGKKGDKWGDYGMEVLAPVFNGVFLVTPDMVGLYLTSVKLLPANAYFKSSDTLKIYGSGKETNKVYMNAELPGATTAVEGLLAITNLSASVASSTAISQKAVTDLKNLLDNYVDDSYTINGKRFVADGNGNMVLTLTKTDFGIDKMDNTAPLAKPVTKALSTVLAGKALSDHTHTIGDLDNVPYGSTSVTGLVKLWDVLDTTNDKLATARLGFVLDQKIDVLSDKINTLLPAWTVGGASYGNDSFLPIPALGNYEGYTKNQTYQKGMVRYQNGKLYSLRNGSNGVPPGDWGIYYAYMDVASDATLSNVQQTSVRYHPAGMSKFPGVKLQAILITGRDAIVCLGDDGKRYLVLFNGTIDHAKHTQVCEVTVPDYQNGNGTAVTTNPFAPTPEMDDLVISGSNVYLLRNTFNNSSYYVAAWSLRIADVASNTAVAFNRVTLNGEGGMSGDNLIIRNGQKTDATQTGQFFSAINAAGIVKWNNARNFVHGPEASHMVFAKEGVIRVNHVATVWFASSTGATINFQLWQTSYLLDTTTNKVTLECPTRFPITADDVSVKYADGSAIGEASAKWGGGSANRRTYGAVMEDFVISQTNNGDPDLMPEIYIASAKGADPFDFLRYDYKVNNTYAGITLNQGRGSVYESGLNFPLSLGGNSPLLWLSSPRGRLAIEVEVDPNGTYGVPGYGGFGPTNNRRVVDSGVYEQLSQMAMIITPTQSGGVLNGWQSTGPETFPYKNVANTFSIATDRYTLSTTDWNKMKQMIIDNAPTGAANGYASEYILAANNAGKALFSLWFLGIGTPQQLCIAQVACTKVVNNANILDIYYFVMQPTFTATNVTFPSVSLLLLDFFNNLDYGLDHASLGEITGGKTKRVGQPLLVTNDGINFGLSLPYTLTIRQIGDLGALNYMASLKLSSGTWSKVAGKSAVRRMAPAHHPESPVYIGQTKQVVKVFVKADAVFCSGEAYSTASFVTDPAMPAAGTPVILAGVQTAEGWILYLTEQVGLDFGSSKYTVPTWEADLEAMFPDNHANQTFYLHARVDNDTPSYVLDTTQHPDSANELFVGVVKTDSNRIVEINVDRVKRLGNVKQVLEHAAVAYRHDMDVARDSKLGTLAPLRKEAIGALNGSGDGYLDSQQTYGVVMAQKRPKKNVSYRFSDLAKMKFSDFSNVAERFWIQSPKVTTVLPAEHAAAAARNMSWIGANAGGVDSAGGYQAMTRVRFTVPGTDDGSTKMVYLAIGVPKSTIEFMYSLTTDDDSTLTTFSPSDDSLFQMSTALPSGKPAVLTILTTFEDAVYSAMLNKFITFELRADDQNGALLRSSDANCPFQIFNVMETTLGSGFVTRAIERSFGNSTLLLNKTVTTGQDAFQPPTQGLKSGSTFTLTVATEYGSEHGIVELDDLQVNLMFRT
ncbi:hypothetical protein pEaSNUABM29_00265 [Erwinia phage pEa_SNUABM_29]|nr:hypothetical protein pEaSNUABM29_00265 [Erwinia phage pEa_SNUABM_29]